MAGDPVTAIATLLSQVFGFAVDPNGYARMSRERQLQWIQRGIDDAIRDNDWASYDALLGELRTLRQQAG